MSRNNLLRIAAGGGAQGCRVLHQDKRLESADWGDAEGYRAQLVQALERGCEKDSQGWVRERDLWRHWQERAKDVVGKAQIAV